MIETHVDPDNARSDAKQQVTPSQLEVITHELKIRQKSSSKEEFQRKLSMFRKELDLLDNNLVDLLSDRKNISIEIGKIKKKENVAILQSSRWTDILANMVEAGQKSGLNKEYIVEIFKAIHVESIKIQHNVNE
jgi:chorismate mutase